MPLPKLNPVRPPSSSTEAASPDPTEKVGRGQVAKLVQTHVNAITSRLDLIAQGAKRDDLKHYRRPSRTAQVPTGASPVAVNGPANGTLWAIHRVIVAVQATTAGDTPTVSAGSLLYSAGADNGVPPLANLFLALNGTGAAFTVDLGTPLLFRGGRNLIYVPTLTGTITTPANLFIGLDVEALPENPSMLDVT